MYTATLGVDSGVFQTELKTLTCRGSLSYSRGPVKQDYKALY